MSNKVRIGVFIPNGAQSLDTATVDVLGVLSKEYFSELPFLPKHMYDAAPNVSFAYITTPEQGPDIPLTSGMTVKATHVYSDPDVAPGQLDVVIVPGPSPTAVFEKGGLEWLRQQHATEGVDVLSVCTGLYICASAGIADGKNVSGPRGLQDDLSKKFPKIKLVGDKQRWEQDGNLWSSGTCSLPFTTLQIYPAWSELGCLPINHRVQMLTECASPGGITNGNELMAAYARGSPHWANKGVVEFGLKMTDVGERGKFYGEGATMFTLGVAWQIVKAWFVGGGKTKTV